MSTISPVPVAEKGEWKTMQLRFTVFSNSTISNGGELFQEFFGFSPDAETNKRAQFLSEFTADSPGLNYQANFTGPKADFVLSGTLNLESPACPAVLPVEADHYCEAAVRICKRISSAKRIALGQYFVLKVASKDEAYKRMSQFLHSVDVDFKNTSDFLYRLNRPRTLQLSGSELKINRLSQWSCSKFHFNVESSGQPPHEALTAYGVSLLTDINTAAEADFSNLNEENRLVVIQKLFTMSTELSLMGDIP